ncbi:MAG: hypothetical protein AAFV53_29180 [Myxococcota bacterium]
MKWPRRVIDFRFHTPLSPEQARARVEALDERGEGQSHFVRRKLQARVIQNELRMHRDRGRNLIAEVHAAIEPDDAGSAIVGQAFVHWFTWSFPIVALFFFVPYAAGMITDDVPTDVMWMMIGGLICSGFGIGFLMWQAIRNRNQMLQQLKDALVE